jgi:hypothetical protein
MNFQMCANFIVLEGPLAEEGAFCLLLYLLFSFSVLWGSLQIRYNACLNTTITQFACGLFIYIFLVYLSALSTVLITTSDGEKIGE